MKPRNKPQNRGRSSGRKPPPIGHRWVKGQSGNPGGRPSVASLAKACRQKLEEPFPNDPEGRSYAEVIADKLARLAAKGDISAARELADRAEGRPRQQVEVSGDGTVHFVIEPARPQTPQAWLAAHAESQRAIVEADTGQGESGGDDEPREIP